MKTKHLLSLIALAMLCTTNAWGATSYSITGTSPNKTLTITGSGAMTDYASGGAPWYSERSNIKTIVINEGVTYVGAYAFQGITYSSITIPVSATGFGARAFMGISSGTVRNVYYAGTPNEWANIDFPLASGGSLPSSHPFYSNNDSTKNHFYFYGKNSETVDLVFSEGLTTIKQFAFYKAGNIVDVYIPGTVTSIEKQALNCVITRLYINKSVAPTTGTTAISWKTSGTYIYLRSDATSSYNKQPWINSTSGTNTGAKTIGYADYTGTRVSCSWKTGNLHKVSGTVNSINWTLDEEGTLTLRGHGAITSTFNTTNTNAGVLPWFRFRRLVNKVVVEPDGEDITSISNAIQYCYMVKEITIKQTTIPTATFTPNYSYKVSTDKITVYVDNSSAGDAKLSGAPWNDSGLDIEYTATFCSDPSDITISSIGTTTATASWTDDSGDTKYICKPASEEEPTSSEWASAASTNSKSVALSSLTPGTRYTFYLMSDCGTMTSNVIDAEFTTECEVISIPWNYGFESCTNNQTPLCWGELKKAGSTNGSVQANTLASKTGTFGLRIAGGRSNGSPKSEVIAVFPEFDDEISNLELSFYYKTDVDIIDDYWGNHIYGKLQLGFVTTEGSFVPFGDPLAQRSTFGKVEDINMSSASDGARFAILYTGGDELGYAAIDDITVTEKPSCNKPTGVAVTADSETAEGATITWDANSMSNWKLQVSEGDAASWGEEIAVNSTSYTFTGLKANTIYYVRVKADCGGESVSEWSDNVSFTTLCGTINVSAASPWSIDFEGLGDHVIPECWDNTASTTTSSWGDGYIWGTYERSSNKSLAMDNSVCDGGTAIINTPEIVIPADGKEYELTFDYANMAIAGNNMLVKISANGGAFTTKGTYYPSGNVSSYPPLTFTTATINLADYSGQTIKIQFFANPTSGTSSTDGAMFVDNVSVHKVPTCFQPTALAASNLTANSAHMTWTAGASETAWRLQYRADGGEWSSEIAVSGSAQRDLTGLSANTEYFVRVKAYCDAEDQSNWSDVLSFTTLCAAASMPYEEEFSIASELPSCWEASTTSVNGWSAYEKSGAYAVQLRTGSSGEATLRMPAVALSEDAILRFEWKNASGAQVNVYVSTDGGSSRTMLPNDLSNVHSDWTTKVLDLSAYTGQTALIYFVANFTTANQYAYLDDVEVVARPCEMILSITATPITGGATLSWSGNVQKIRYKKGSDAWSYATPANNAGPHTLTGLTPANSYQFCLLPNCLAEEEANWTSPVWFLTNSTESVPYSNDFEAETPGDVPFNWNRISTSEYPQVSHDSYAYRDGGSFGDQGNSIKFYGANDQIIVMPEFDQALGNLMVSFHYRNRDCTMQLGYVEADGSTFVALENLPNQTGYGEYPFEKDLYGISSDAKKLAIRYSNAGGSAQAWVDNVEVKEATCGQPTNLAFDNVTATTAHISWSASDRGTESNYQYIRQIWSEDAPNWASATLISSSVIELNLTGLTANKEYEFYLRSYCGVSDQSTPVKITFKTLMKEEVFEDVVDADDNQDRLEALMDQTLDITIKRPLLRNGDYCTLCLPFDLSAAQIADSECPLHGFVIKEFDKSTESSGEVNIYLNQVTSIEAGKAYFVRYAGEPTDVRLTPLTFRGVKIKLSSPLDEELSDDCTPYGVFNPHPLVANDQSTLFLSSNNTLYYPSANGTMNGFRAYIKVGSGSSLGAPIRNGAIIRIVEKENTATGVGEVQGDNVQCTKVLRDGQIIIIRDGKEYNAQGVLIR